MMNNYVVKNGGDCHPNDGNLECAVEGSLIHF